MYIPERVFCECAPQEFPTRVPRESVPQHCLLRGCLLRMSNLRECPTRAAPTIPMSERRLPPPSVATSRLPAPARKIDLDTSPTRAKYVPATKRQRDICTCRAAMVSTFSEHTHIHQNPSFSFPLSPRHPALPSDHPANANPTVAAKSTLERVTFFYAISHTNLTLLTKVYTSQEPSAHFARCPLQLRADEELVRPRWSFPTARSVTPGIVGPLT